MVFATAASATALIRANSITVTIETLLMLSPITSYQNKKMQITFSFINLENEK